MVEVTAGDKRHYTVNYGWSYGGGQKTLHSKLWFEFDSYGGGQKTLHSKLWFEFEWRFYVLSSKAIFRTSTYKTSYN